MKRILSLFFISIFLWGFAEDGTHISDEDTVKLRAFPKVDQAIFWDELSNIETFTQWDFPPEGDPGKSELEKKMDEIIEYCTQYQKFVKSITGMEEVSLPLGLTGHTNDGFLAQMVIIKAKATQQYLEFSAFARVRTQYEGTDLYFAADSLKLSYEGGVIGTWKLHYLGEASFPLFGGKMLFSLLGSDISKSDGKVNGNSYIEFDCDGFKQFNFKADIRIDRSLVIPVDETGNRIPLVGEISIADTPKKVIDNDAFVGCELELTANGWNDFLFQVSLPSFEMKNLEGWTFKLDNAILDLSESQNGDGIVFPQSYSDNNLFLDGNVNAWKGFYSKQLSVVMPPEFKNVDQNARTQFTAHDLVLDNYGVSGLFSATNVVDKGSATGWQFKVDSISLKVGANSLIDGRCSGALRPAALDSYLDFSGYITPHQYQFNIEIDSADISMFKGKLVFQQNSYLQMVRDNTSKQFKADAYLNGYLNVLGALGDNEMSGSAGDVIDFKGIQFQNLHLSSHETPRISAEYFGFQGDLNLANFPIGISDVEIAEKNNQEIALAFDCSVNLAENANISGETSLEIIGKVDPNNSNFQNYKFHKIAMDSVKIDITTSGYSLKGSVEYFSEDTIYARGFRGAVELKLEKLNIQGSAKAMFGKKDFRYWYVDFAFGPNSNQTGKLKIGEIAGSLSHRMKRSNGNNPWNVTNNEYVPDGTKGLAFKAGVALHFGQNQTAFSARALLQCAYNHNGGLNSIYFLGEGSVMNSSINPRPSPAETRGALLSKLDAYTASDSIVQVSNQNLLEITRGSHPASEIAAGGKFGAYVSILKDFENNVFDGLFEMYLNTPGLKGGGENGLAGMARIYSSPSKSFLYVGAPTTPISLTFPINPPLNITVGAYFMTGDQLPEQIPPPAQVLEILGSEILNSNRESSVLSQARGFAVGFNVALSYNLDKEVNSGIGAYAELEIGAGIDVMSRQVDGLICADTGLQVGRNGWFSSGQIYAYLYGKFGVKVNVFKKPKKFNILNAGVAAILRGEFPNPTKFTGTVGASYSLLGGRLEGRITYQVEFGEDCEIVQPEQDNFELAVIADIKPDNETDVDVFKIPQIAFNFPVNEPISLDTDGGIQTYRVQLQNFSIKQGNTSIPGTQEWTDNNTKLNFISTDILPPYEQITGNVTIAMEERKGNTWTPLLDDNGQPITESKDFHFTTSSAPDYIPLQNIVYAYPMPDTNNFYPNEHGNAYIQLDRGQGYLFTGNNSNWEIKGEMYAGTNRVSQQDLVYDATENKLIFPFSNLQTSSEYTFNIVAYPPGMDPAVASANDINTQTTENFTNSIETNVGLPDSNWEEVTYFENATAEAGNKTGVLKSLLEFDFNTSQYGTFTEKVNAIPMTGSFFVSENTFVQILSQYTGNYELFNEAELLGTQYTDATPMIRAEAVLNDTYYSNMIHPLIYQNYPLDGDIELSRDVSILGLPPVRVNDIPAYYSAGLSITPKKHYITQRLPFVYKMASGYYNDFLDLKTKIINRYLSPYNPAKYHQYQYIIDGQFPIIQPGNYTLKYIYGPKGNEFRSEATITYQR